MNNVTTPSNKSLSSYALSQLASYEALAIQFAADPKKSAYIAKQIAAIKAL